MGVQQHARSQLAHINVLRIAAVGGVERRQVQQLLAQVGRTLQALLQRLGGCSAAGFVMAAKQHMRLCRERRQRRAQPVGGVVHKSALQRQVLAQARQQCIERAAQRLQLGVAQVRTQRLQVAPRVQRLDALRELAQGPQAAAHGQPQREQQHGQGDQQRDAHLAHQPLQQLGIGGQRL